MTDADPAGIRRRTWSVGGSTLSALEAGDPDREDVVVLLHGVPASAELWRDVLPQLAAAGRRAIAFDLPGYGHTRVPAGADHSLAGAAELVASWLRLHVGRGAWLVGHDLGGAVAQVLAARHPTLPSRLTLADTVVEDSWPVAPVRVLRTVARAGLYPAACRVRLVPNPYLWRELRRGFADSARLTPELARRVFLDTKVTESRGRHAFARHLRALDSEQTMVAAGSLPRLTMPTQLVWGAEDRFQPWGQVGARLQDLLPDPAVTLLPDTGHFAPAESPAAFARALLDWAAAAQE